jgi:hypothetical protein
VLTRRQDRPWVSRHRCPQLAIGVGRTRESTNGNEAVTHARIAQCPVHHLTALCSKERPLD